MAFSPGTLSDMRSDEHITNEAQLKDVVDSILSQLCPPGKATYKIYMHEFARDLFHQSVLTTEAFNIHGQELLIKLSRLFPNPAHHAPHPDLFSALIKEITKRFGGGFTKDTPDLTRQYLALLVPWNTPGQAHRWQKLNSSYKPQTSGRSPKKSPSKQPLTWRNTKHSSLPDEKDTDTTQSMADVAGKAIEYVKDTDTIQSMARAAGKAIEYVKEGISPSKRTNNPATPEQLAKPQKKPSMPEAAAAPPSSHSGDTISPSFLSLLHLAPPPPSKEVAEWRKQTQSTTNSPASASPAPTDQSLTRQPFNQALQRKTPLHSPIRTSSNTPPAQTAMVFSPDSTTPSLSSSKRNRRRSTFGVLSSADEMGNNRI